MRILVIEDNKKMASLLRQGLTEQGHAVDVAATGQDGEEMATGAGEAYDAIVLDVMLPDVEGIQVCRNLRRRGLQTPILMLTALSTTADKVMGLDAGADDYLTKPFEFDELVARIRALFRRGQAHEAGRLTCGDLEVDLLARSVIRDGRTIIGATEGNRPIVARHVMPSNVTVRTGEIPPRSRTSTLVQTAQYLKRFSDDGGR